jgi:LPPG:FO 2-phospho-L-lactate transferase
MKVVTLAGGVGGARFLTGVKAALGEGHELTAIVNIGDDIWLHGLRICPDLDTCMYTLGAGIDTDKGWGRKDETWSVKAELAAYGADPDWFGLGDRDVATHLVRSRMLRAGYPLSAVTEALCDRWQPGMHLLPASDDRVETHVVITDPDTGDQRAVHFQEWWIRYRAAVPARAFVSIGAQDATVAPGVAEAIAEADVILLAPSNPVVSISTILEIPGIRSALTKARAPIVGVSPIIGGKPVRGMADACLAAIGVETSAQAVGEHYGARSAGGLLDGWLVDAAESVAIDGVTVAAVPLLMSDEQATAAMVKAALSVAGVS